MSPAVGLYIFSLRLLFFFFEQDFVTFSFLNEIFPGQQNVQMPPRPSSSQSDGSGPARMSHSPMTTQGK